MSVLQIREAVDEDFAFVSDVMQEALEPFYNGDHRAHARRIFDTHIQGGEDRVGHFSTEQRMFILTEDGRPIGMINIVGKRQGTYKVSPLIIAQEHQGKRGYGSLLLAHAERYAREHGARQMYCTVARENIAALQFFRRKGYVPAGHSESHYKAGITEVVLYKLFHEVANDEQFDRVNVSVLPFDDTHADQVRRLILENVPEFFWGVDDGWVDALYRGYSRRDSGEVNEKFKLIYVAIDREGIVHGVAGVTPKKGEPIKLMPFVADGSQAFTALLTDVPEYLRPYGRKLYVHIVPSVAEVIALQRLGWTMDALMPGAYHDSFATQQWGYALGDGTMRNMRVKKQFFDLIVSGRKSLEVRVDYDSIKRIRPGERMRVLTSREEAMIRIRDVRRYRTFTEMLNVEDPGRISPGDSKEDVLTLLQRIYPSDKEALGVVVLELERG